MSPTPLRDAAALYRLMETSEGRRQLAALLPKMELSEAKRAETERLLDAADRKDAQGTENSGDIEGTEDIECTKDIEGTQDTDHIDDKKQVSRADAVTDATRHPAGRSRSILHHSRGRFPVRPSGHSPTSTTSQQDEVCAQMGPLYSAPELHTGEQHRTQDPTPASEPSLQDNEPVSLPPSTPIITRIWLPTVRSPSSHLLYLLGAYLLWVGVSRLFSPRFSHTLPNTSSTPTILISHHSASPIPPSLYTDLASLRTAADLLLTSSTCSLFYCAAAFALDSWIGALDGVIAGNHEVYDAVELAEGVTSLLLPLKKYEQRGQLQSWVAGEDKIWERGMTELQDGIWEVLDRIVAAEVLPAE